MTREIKKCDGLLSTVVLLAAACFLLQCAHLPDRRSPDYPDLRPGMKHFLLLPPEINLFQELPGGKLLWQADDSRKARESTGKALSALMQAHALDVRTAGADDPHRSERMEVQALFRNVNRSIQLHTYGPQIFKTKLDRFDYSLGPVAALLAKTRSDALVCVAGHQTLSARNPKAWLSIAVVEPTGRIVWYGMQGGRTEVSLQTPDGVSDLVGQALRPFLEAGS